MSETKDLTSLTQLRSQTQSEPPPLPQTESQEAHDLFAPDFKSPETPSDLPFDDSPIMPTMNASYGIPPISEDASQALHEDLAVADEEVVTTATEQPNADSKAESESDSTKTKVREGNDFTQDFAHSDTASLAPSGIQSDRTRQSKPESSFDNVKAYSDQVSPRKSYVMAENPFTLSIKGSLDSTEQERLLEILKREDIGIPPLELETQFQNHSVMIPQISEYTAILIAQALRNSKTTMSITEGDSALYDEATEPRQSSTSHSNTNYGSQEPSAAASTYAHTRHLEITAKSHLSQSSTELEEAVDTFQLAGFVKGHGQAPPDSQAISHLSERLKEQMRSLASIKGADGITQFKMSIEPNAHTLEIWIKIEGVAVKKLLTKPDTSVF